ncbi:MAG: hypothetical protein AB1411_08715 [Nitrospirota bacterium]
MSAHSLVLEEKALQVAEQAAAQFDGARVEPILNWDQERPAGFLIDSFLERIAVVVCERKELLLRDVRTIRQAMARAQARRVLLYVPDDMVIPNPVMLLAALSKIEIVRMTETH